MKSSVLIGAAIAASACSTLASSINISYVGQNTVSGIVVAGRTSAGGIAGGHINFRYGPGGSAPGATGQFQGGQGAEFSTFCIELGQFVSGSSLPFDLDDLENAPNPASGGPGNTTYGAAIEQLINNVLAQAIAWDWIRNDLGSDTNTTRVRLAATQAAIWGAIYGANNISFVGDSLVNDSNGQSVSSAYNALIASLNNNVNVSGRFIAALNGSQQDLLYVVPLPPAAFAGLATLVGVAGVARLRRR